MIQHAITSSPVLSYFDPRRPVTEVFTDASKFAIGGWLRQTDDEGKEHIVCYWSRKLIPAEVNYPTHEREFMGMYEFIKRFRIYLHGVPFVAHVDHKAMMYLQEQPYLSERQARWITFLQEFEFRIEYIPGELNSFADFLSRRPDFALSYCEKCSLEIRKDAGANLAGLTTAKEEEGTDDKEGEIEYARACVIALNTEDQKESQLADAFCRQLEQWRLNPVDIPANKRGYAKAFTKTESGVWCRGDAVVIAESQKLEYLQHVHDRSDSGHFGFFKGYSALSEVAYWPGMIDDLTMFIKSCAMCQRVKPRNLRPFGLLKPLAIPETIFESINIDFGEVGADSHGYNRFLVIRDRLTKFVCLVPCKDTLTAKECAELLYKRWYLEGRGFPKSIVSDRDTLFTSSVWKEFCRIVGIELAMSTSRHQQTNGGAESAVKMVKRMLKGYVNYRQSDWTDYLAEIAFAYNDSVHPATGFRPFLLAQNFEPGVLPSVASKTGMGKMIESSKTRLEEAHRNLFKAQEAAIQTYNGGRSRHFTIAVGSYVLLDREGIKWAPEAKRRATLLAPFLGPFKVLSFDDSRLNAKLELPSHMRCHSEFHISKLREWIAPNHHFPDRESTRPLVPAVTKDGNEEFEVDKILDTRIRYKRREYLIKWVDAAEKENSWEPELFLTNCNEAKELFESSLSESKDSRGGVMKVGRALRGPSRE
jgi:hypothetical protein